MKELEELLAFKGLRTAYGREKVVSLFTEVWFRKGQLLAIPGQQVGTMYVLKNGLVRGYKRYASYEATFWFSYDGQFILPDGILSGAPSEEYIEVLEEIEGYALNMRQVEGLLAEVPQSALFFLRLMEEKALLGKQREALLRMPAAADRYLSMQDTNPEVLKRATQEMVASYLHLSPKHLSRIRRNEAKGTLGKK